MQITGIPHENIPQNLAETMTQATNLTVLADAGLTVIGTYEFTAHIWTLETLGRLRPLHPFPVSLGDRVEAFERDLRDRLLAVQPNGNFEETVSFTHDLAIKPAHA